MFKTQKKLDKIIKDLETQNRMISDIIETLDNRRQKGASKKNELQQHTKSIMDILEKQGAPPEFVSIFKTLSEGIK